MSRLIDLTGKRFGKLVVTGYAFHSDYSGVTLHYWKCDCDCGAKDIIVRGDSLRSGNTKSCGCIRSELSRRNCLKAAKSRTQNIEYNGESHTIAEWHEITGISAATLYSRKNKGKPVEEILSKEKLKSEYHGGRRKKPREKCLKIMIDGEELTYAEAAKKTGKTEAALRAKEHRKNKIKNRLTYGC